jgi:hypothetical protein
MNGVSITEFLNVDLDIYASYDLQPLVDALGRKVMALYVGRQRRSYAAHLELAGIPRSPDAAIRRLCAAVQALPRRERQLWSRARRRDFSIGVQAGEQPHARDFTLDAPTVELVARLGARIVVTVYSPEELSKQFQTET